MGLSYKQRHLGREKPYSRQAFSIHGTIGGADLSIAQNVIYTMYKNRLYKYSMTDDNWELINSAFPAHQTKVLFSFLKTYMQVLEWHQAGYYGGYWYKDEDIFRYDINNSVWSFFDRWDQF